LGSEEEAGNDHLGISSPKKKKALPNLEKGKKYRSARRMG